MKNVLHTALVCTLLIVGCRKDPAIPMPQADAPFPLQLPAGAPFPEVPDDNPLTVASVQLGKALFFDPRLSRDGTVSCASCHHPDRAFSDTVALSVGIDQQTGGRNAPSLANVAYHPYFFRDGGVSTLERQVIAPVQDPLEMDHSLELAAAAVSGDVEYEQLSRSAYGRPMDGFVVTRAIANYERTLISGWSRFDRYFYQNDGTALTDAEVRGWDLFRSAALNCTACHSGFDLSDHSFQNIGQYLDYADPGRERISLDPLDNGKFKVPTLRNIALTAPYMHDGSIPTLDGVIDLFASGGLPHPNRSPLLPNFALNADQKGDLIAFLNALTDERSIDQVP
ncbi:MAG: cytochrome-c peroxidase [Flavobacteriales bacterium]|nr:cytochrome-c peroxidase [Flavobacteriales bacterium]